MELLNITSRIVIQFLVSSQNCHIYTYLTKKFLHYYDNFLPSEVFEKNIAIEILLRHIILINIKEWAINYISKIEVKKMFFFIILF